MSPAPSFPPLAKSDLNWLQSESDRFQLSVRFGWRVSPGLLRSRYRAGTKVFSKSIDVEPVFLFFFVLGECMFLLFPYLLNSCSRGFRGVPEGLGRSFFRTGLVSHVPTDPLSPPQSSYSLRTVYVTVYVGKPTFFIQSTLKLAKRLSEGVSF